MPTVDQDNDNPFRFLSILPSCVSHLNEVLDYCTGFRKPVDPDTLDSLHARPALSMTADSTSWNFTDLQKDAYYL
jgi:hypothetical protein